MLKDGQSILGVGKRRIKQDYFDDQFEDRMRGDRKRTWQWSRCESNIDLSDTARML